MVNAYYCEKHDNHILYYPMCMKCAEEQVEACIEEAIRNGYTRQEAIECKKKSLGCDNCQLFKGKKGV